MNGDTIRTITIRGQSEGLDKLTADVNKLAAAQQNVAVVSEQSAKRVLSLEDAWKRQTLRLDEAARAQANIARETKVADAALREGLATQAQHAQRLDQINQRYAATATATKNVAQQTGLARHELVNMSRQIQDVGVSLASGQSPFMVAIQQGSQIADVFANSTGTLKGFFGQAVAGAGRFLGSFAGAATVVAGLGASIVYVANQYATSQLDISRALAGIGAASGVTREQLNKMASESATAFGLSTKEAREAATTFVSTGEISGENIAKATGMVKDFARATGTDAAEATKRLAAAMLDPARGALELDKSLGALDATTINYIRSLQAQGKQQEAIAVMLDRLNPKVQKQAEYVQGLPLLWDLATNALSNWYGMVGKIAMQGPLPAITPPDAGDGGQTDLNNMSKKADAAALSIMGVTAQITALQTELSKLSKYREAISGPMTGAEQVGNVLLQQLRDQEQVLIRQAIATQQLAALYPGMTIEGAKQLDLMNQQLQVTQARTGAEQIILQQMVDENRYQNEGKGIIEAINLALANRANAEANVKNSILDQIKGLEDQIALSQARLNGTEALVKAEQAYRDVFNKTQDEALAQAAKMTTLRLADQQAHEQSVNAYRAETQQLEYVGDEIDNNTTKMKRFNNELKSAYGYVSMFGFSDTMASLRARADQGPIEGLSDQAYNAYNIKAGLESVYGEENVEAFTVGTGSDAYSSYQLKQDYIDKQLADMRASSINSMDVGSPAALQASWQKTISYGIKDGLTSVNRVIDAAAYDPATQASLIQQTIDYVRNTQPPGLAREEMITTLNSKLEQLANSTDSLNATMQNALSPFYSQDPRTTKLGFRAGVTGNPDWATGAGNANPLVAVLGSGATAPGMAGGGSFTVGGGYSANDNRMAVFPVASGEEVVVNRNRDGGRGGQVVHIDNRIIITGSVDADALSKMKVSRYQQAQRMRGQIAQA